MFEGVHFAYPWCFFLLPVFLLLPYLRRRQFASSIPVARIQVEQSAQSGRSLIRRFLLPVIHLGFLSLLLFAAARPQKITLVSLGEENRRNLMLALDTSRSMDAQDFLSPKGVIRRIDGVKFVTRQFIQERYGDRIGLVLFGSKAYLQAPLTIDHSLLASLVDEIRLGVAGDGTAIGDGLGVALKRIQELPAETRAIILLTDGVSNSGRVEPLKAANIAKELGVKVYTIGIGSKQGGYINLDRGMFRPQRVRVEFDEETLKEISRTTGGKYFFASDMNELDLIYREIDRIERTEREEFQFVKTEELASPYLIGAFLCFLMHFLLSQTVLRVVP